jgi:glucose repression mediator protein
VWSSLGHCYLMMDDLQQAYSAYQQALYHLPDPKEPKLWYGIGILYDRYGSLEHAEEAFSQVMRMEPNFEKANEIYFRLGIIYKQQQKFQQSLEVSPNVAVHIELPTDMITVLPLYRDGPTKAP